jgi:hypothetical protein
MVFIFLNNFKEYLSIILISKPNNELDITNHGRIIETETETESIISPLFFCKPTKKYISFYV